METFQRHTKFEEFFYMVCRELKSFCNPQYLTIYSMHDFLVDILEKFTERKNDCWNGS